MILRLGYNITHHKDKSQEVYRLLLGLLDLSCPLGHGVSRGGLASLLGSSNSLSSDVLGGSKLSILLKDSGIRVKLEHGPDVLQGVGLHHCPAHLPVGSPQHSTDALRLEKAGEVSVGHLGLRQVPALLLTAGLLPGSIETIQLLEGRLSPNTKPSHVTTRGELEEVEVVHLDGVAPGNIPEGLGDPLVLVIHNKGPQLLDMPPVPQLALASPHPAGGIDTSNILPGLAAAEESNSILGLGQTLDSISNNKGDLRNALDLVTLSHNEGRDSSGSDGRADGVPLLGHIDLPVPPPPLLGGGEHPASPAHVAKGSLARPVGATSPHTGDPGHGPSCAPGLGTCLVASRLRDAVRLATVLGNLIVDSVDDVRPHGSLEDCGEADSGAPRGGLVTVDSDQRSSCRERHIGRLLLL